MRKKIGDLTLREVLEEQNKICNKDTKCDDCPFRGYCLSVDLDLEKEIEIGIVLGQEVEVEEE